MQRIVDPESHAVEAVLADVWGARSVYQPIVDLDSRVVVGYEALARWPAVPGVDVGRVFDEAAGRGVVRELDWACRLAALSGAAEAGLSTEYSVFINVEPHNGPVIPDFARRMLDSFDRPINVVIELTERSLMSDPATLLTVVDAARRLGCSVALDDVGANEATVTMLEFVAPDIIKLDRTLVQSDPSPAQARVIAAVRAHAEFTGATILAEGVENEEHLARARALGATLGQGWLFGRPAALPSDTSRRRDVLERTPSVVSRRRSSAGSAVPEVPSDLFEEIAPLVGRKAFVLSMARQIEDHARGAVDPLIVLSAFQRARWFAPNVVDRYADLATLHPFIAALGVGLPDEPAPGVRGAALDATERFSGEWTVTAVGRHYFAALIARDLGDVDVPDADRRFEFILTHDRRLVVSAARSLMRRVLPSRG
ncbi:MULTISPECIES: EAL domain-containing protein [Nocardiaceae]|uniref:EAL domain-containing protein (Putative c-di-GMP-specific phosphodiesterase class I) n=1 Tax=Rhodococcoides corynebacterioides TaxID=53972 RepID=A0ABS2KU54_9NOCA|nr:MULTISPECIES: EAL domain-containing protein [Rhodococcus]MBM7415464.1 EAL domain-containing protein (putative c-di-GMP-specific phosphodiesterase class I) [Rhodococcus corynebacterioides]MBP1117926.1 EAL domain-containing protein (putative c-di-GMP-specific phosphodiesterase class I) [Rhodococcus sp. PvP016]